MNPNPVPIDDFESNLKSSMGRGQAVSVLESAVTSALSLVWVSTPSL